LAAVVQGGAPEALLDSYASERIPHVRDYVELAVRMGRLLNATGTEDMVSAAAARGESTDRMESIRPRLGPGLHRGGSPLTGRPSPQPRLGDGRRLDDAVGLGPVLLLREHAAMDSQGVPAVAAGNDWLAGHGLAAALLRPDRYVFGVAETLDEAALLCETYAAETGGAGR
ncbi:MAG: 3-(3-hydroxyphenyl)propionate hydroxylase, partial [Alphaproteobacteria bacterium]|nr:3-(3-hydroxyphenyl)propionate hydroxylase [Alphaproteobacteria bacterium]